MATPSDSSQELNTSAVNECWGVSTLGGINWCWRYGDADLPHSPLTIYREFLEGGHSAAVLARLAGLL